eukprot:CAMPEP_0172483716 /NCGR_PEP_ID=MMETSP1066-20121228/10838_1 /TAXON_ID=671091 /ORGANISM="Coscinodiscus wailesii, Strain CCMP2513" /LENGTH=55 /DNA_ID=CAMNT_0013247779 /DNA_START=116 /DNA_END=279 /DNA_ORIENTATION=-
MYKNILEPSNFTNWKGYSVVGDNSGPNQAALYSGSPLKQREGISSKKRMWIWDRL